MPMIVAETSLFSRLVSFLDQVPFNTFFARAVLEQRVSGEVYVDDLVKPGVVYVRHRCGMALLCGKTASEPFNRALVSYMLNLHGDRTRPELLQVWPLSWRDELAERLGDRFLAGLGTISTPSASITHLPPDNSRVLEWGRVNFRFHPEIFNAREEQPLPSGFLVARAGMEVYSPWHGPVLPADYWNSALALATHGIAYAVYHDSTPVCIAFSSWRLAEILEIGIETHPAFRHRGLATAACRALVRHALAENRTPLWSTSHLNQASRALALRLGFKQISLTPYLRLACNPTASATNRSSRVTTVPAHRH